MTKPGDSGVPTDSPGQNGGDNQQVPRGLRPPCHRRPPVRPRH